MCEKNHAKSNAMTTLSLDNCAASSNNSANENVTRCTENGIEYCKAMAYGPKAAKICEEGLIFQKTTVETIKVLYSVSFKVRHGKTDSCAQAEAPEAGENLDQS